MTATVQLPWESELSASVFHQAFFNTTDALSTTGASDSDQLLTDRLKGQAYGFELMLHRDLNKRLGGFLSYTLSRSDRLRDSRRLVSSFDRSHVLNLALGYDLGERWRLGSRLVFYTGIPRRRPDSVALNQRDPAFFRLDTRLEKRWLIGHAGAWWALVIEMLNTTLNKEVLGEDCQADPFGGETCKPNSIGPVVIPSIGLEGAF